MNRLKAYAIFWASVMVFMSVVSAGIYFVTSQIGHGILSMILAIVWITICYGVTLGILIIFHKRSKNNKLDRGGGAGVGTY